MDNSMITSIHQPSYFPWLGLLDKISKANSFICLDCVQLADRAYQHRNIFLSHDNKVKFLTISIDKKNYRYKPLKEIKISSNQWQVDHSNFILNSYKKHDFFDDIFPEIKIVYEKNYTFLIDVLLDSMNILFKLYNINTELIMQSDLDYNHNLAKSELIIDLLKCVKAKSYLSGSGAKSYQKNEEFSMCNIELNYNSFKHPIYVQKRNDFFIDGLSAIDALFNLGRKSASILLGVVK